MGLDRDSDLFDQFVTLNVLPESQENSTGLDQGVIYAFWHTRNMAKADIFVRDRLTAELRIYTYQTRDGLEKLHNNLKRKYATDVDGPEKIEKLLKK